ncbi:hypothetical protein EZJ58_4754 [Sodalis ligni]|jgi:hypothetical protein|uniref:Uncharacterized protein n=1 Tax=Sodalis ligni TaxID=2697027 RepID=A0A4R1NQ34_9GAMM|nr:hypothetical protein EZJ58_4754 [Sodalis ligni]
MDFSFNNFLIFFGFNFVTVFFGFFFEFLEYIHRCNSFRTARKKYFFVMIILYNMVSLVKNKMMFI